MAEDKRGFFEKLIDLGNDALDAAGVAKEEDPKEEKPATENRVRPRREQASYPSEEQASVPRPVQDSPTHKHRPHVETPPMPASTAFDSWFEAWYDDSHTLKHDYRIFCYAAWKAGRDFALSGKVDIAPEIVPSSEAPPPGPKSTRFEDS